MWWVYAFLYMIEALIVLCVLFLIANLYINYYRREDLPINKFIPFLICEFVHKKHKYFNQDYTSALPIVDEGGHYYLGCERCWKMQRFPSSITKT